MNQYWHRLSTRIDALTLRERAIVFALVALILFTAMNSFMLDPLFARNKALTKQITDEQAKLSVVQSQIQAAVRRQTVDPDAAERERLVKLTEQAQQMRTELQEIQKGLVSPDKMANLLENILKRHGNLRLVSLKTLPTANLADASGTPEKQAAQNIANNKSKIEETGKGKVAEAAKGKIEESKPSEGPVYKHGVEITVEGKYLDMVSYLAELEAMPSQVFWGKAVLNAGDYSKTTLTLTLYTLSLDKQWLNI